jgi:hypothetical protein
MSQIYFYRAVGDLTKLRRGLTETEDELIEIWDVANLGLPRRLRGRAELVGVMDVDAKFQSTTSEKIPNLSWLIPMALDSHFFVGDGQYGIDSGS